VPESGVDFRQGCRAYNISLSSKEGIVRSTLLLFWASAALGQDIPAHNPFATASDQAAGAKIFRAHCAPCHGAGGQGGLGPNLATGTFFHGGTDADLYRTITEGIAGTAMPGTFFDGTQIWQIVAYLRTLGGSAGDVPRGDARHGEALFREKGCAGCHLVRGEGGLQGPDLSFVGSRTSVGHIRESILDPNAQVAPLYRLAKITLPSGSSYSGFVMNEDTYTVQLLDSSRGLQSLRKSDIKSFERDKTSSMPSYRGKLSDSELDDLLSYLWSLRPLVRSE
jgi:putative heme-binding domain-containing protein